MHYVQKVTTEGHSWKTRLQTISGSREGQKDLLLRMDSPLHRVVFLSSIALVEIIVPNLCSGRGGVLVPIQLPCIGSGQGGSPTPTSGWDGMAGAIAPPPPVDTTSPGGGAATCTYQYSIPPPPPSPLSLSSLSILFSPLA